MNTWSDINFDNLTSDLYDDFYNMFEEDMSEFITANDMFYFEENENGNEVLIEKGVLNELDDITRDIISMGMMNITDYIVDQSQDDRVIIDSHPDCSKACQFAQRGTFSLYGLTPGLMTIAEANKIGLFHFRSFEDKAPCRHTYSFYSESKLNEIREYSQLEMDVANEFTAKMRYNERKIREWKKRGNQKKVIEWMKRPHDPSRI